MSMESARSRLSGGCRGVRFSLFSQEGPFDISTFTSSTASLKQSNVNTSMYCLYVTLFYTGLSQWYH